MIPPVPSATLMSFVREFATVQLLIQSSTETRAVDAFALCTIKMERQVRRLFTFSIYQFPCFTSVSIPALKTALAKEKGIYFESFIKGFDALQPTSIAALVGPENTRLSPVLDVVRQLRNKIFHGQLTGQDLSRGDLLCYVTDIQEWCRLLGEGAQLRFKYAGFDDSFQKADDANLSAGFRASVSSVADYASFLKTIARKN